MQLAMRLRRPCNVVARGRASVKGRTGAEVPLTIQPLGDHAWKPPARKPMGAHVDDAGTDIVSPCGFAGMLRQPGSMPPSISQSIDTPAWCSRRDRRHRLTRLPRRCDTAARPPRLPKQEIAAPTVRDDHRSPSGRRESRNKPRRASLSAPGGDEVFFAFDKAQEDVDQPQEQLAGASLVRPVSTPRALQAGDVCTAERKTRLPIRRWRWREMMRRRLP